MSTIPTCRLTAKLHLLPMAAGGHQTAIKKDIYRPQFYLGSSDASCRIDAIEREEMAPGEQRQVELTLLYPERFGMDLRAGKEFEIREGVRVVGWGVIENVKN
jgi:translation elongation factor EF-Tu-like GTPase